MPATRIELDLPAPPGVVFDHLTDADLLVRWWPTAASTDPRPGGSYRLHWAGPGVTLRGMYHVVDRPDLLTYSWSWDHEDAADEVAVELDATDDGTHLRLHHTAHTEQGAEEHREGWEFFLGRLRDLLVARPD